MAQVDQYLLGYRQAEQERLQRQAQMLADESQWLFDQIGVFGWCASRRNRLRAAGYLDLLAERVGPSGTVTGVERSEEAVRLARAVRRRSQPGQGGSDPW